MDDELDDSSFVVAFPLPFRVLFLAGLGILGWAANLHGLRLLGVDAASALDLRTHERASAPALPRSVDARHAHGAHGAREATADSTGSLYSPLYHLALWLGLWVSAAWMLYRSATYGDAALVNSFKYIPSVGALVVLICMISPFDFMQKPERDAFILSIKRCISSPINHRIYFSDVVFADIFTSYAKVLGDVWLSLCMLLPGGSLLAPPKQYGWYRWILPTLMSLPYLVRFRQCVVEYTSSSNGGRRPLWNAVKYASSFPVIFLSAAQRLVPSDILARNDELGRDGTWNSEYMLFRLWLLAALVNSLYSFWWDVTNDWGFDLLQFRSKRKHARPPSMPRALVLPAMQEREASTVTIQHTPKTPLRIAFPYPVSPYPHSAGEHPFGLREKLLYPLPVYPLALFINLVLRLTWSVKLSSHLHAKAQGDGSFFIFWIEVAELVRRWVWVFLRVEWEIVRRAHDSSKRVEEACEGGEVAHSESVELTDTSTRESLLKHQHHQFQE